MTHRGTTLLRAGLGLQSAITAAPVVLAGALTPSAFLVLVLASVAVFVAVLEDQRFEALAFEAVAVVVGALLLLAGVLVPGTLVGLGVSWLLLSRRGRVLVEGPPAVALEVAGSPVAARPVAAPAPVVPLKVPAPRVASVDVLPRRR